MMWLLIEPTIEENPCLPSPCGANANCNDGVCTCFSNYVGNPYSGCRPECIINTDCPRDRACMRNRCQDPCPGTCASNAACNVINHIPMCSCPSGFEGNAFVMCTTVQGRYSFYCLITFFTVLSNTPIVKAVPAVSPCAASPCGPNSVCRENNGQAVCSCLSGYLGSPPTCRPECTINSDCLLTQACINQKCQNPCTGACGLRADCRVINHNPVCQCPSTFIGDPFIQCIPKREKKKLLTVIIFSI